MTEVFVCAAGVTTENFNQRNLSVVGYLIRTGINLFKFYLHAVILYNALQQISPVEQISIVVRVDKSLNIALAAPVVLIDYYRGLGVDHVFVLGNDAVDDTVDWN